MHGGGNRRIPRAESKIKKTLKGGLMLSWKQKKVREEKRKARRIGKGRFLKSNPLRRKNMPLPTYKRPQLSFRQRLSEKLKGISFRRIFKKQKH